MELKSKYGEIWKMSIEALEMTGYRMPSRPLRIHTNTEPDKMVGIIEDCYSFCLSHINETYKAVPEIKDIADWLCDNDHKGLLLQGHCGRGKTFLAKYVLPLLIKQLTGKIANYYDMTYAIRHTDEVLNNSIIILDDIGVEGRYQEYGNIRQTLAELVDLAEKQGKLIIITTNLTTRELTQEYGERTVDRLHKLCKQIIFQGTSFR